MEPSQFGPMQMSQEHTLQNFNKRCLKSIVSMVRTRSEKLGRLVSFDHNCAKKQHSSCSTPGNSDQGPDAVELTQASRLTALCNLILLIPA